MKQQWQESVMARTIWIEEDRGTYRGAIVHPHNGYDTGGFWPEPESGTPTRPSWPVRRRSGPLEWTNVT
jgi:hypothetical protein